MSQFLVFVLSTFTYAWWNSEITELVINVTLKVSDESVTKMLQNDHTQKASLSKLASQENRESKHHSSDSSSNESPTSDSQSQRQQSEAMISSESVSQNSHTQSHNDHFNTSLTTSSHIDYNKSNPNPHNQMIHYSFNTPHNLEPFPPFQGPNCTPSKPKDEKSYTNFRVSATSDYVGPLSSMPRFANIHAPNHEKLIRQQKELAQQKNSAKFGPLLYDQIGIAIISGGKRPKQIEKQIESLLGPSQGEINLIKKDNIRVCLLCNDGKAPSSYTFCKQNGGPITCPILPAHKIGRVSAKLNQGYVQAMDYIFLEQGFSFGAILEDDLLPSPAFISYLVNVGKPSMDKDPTILAVSGWNDNQFETDANHLFIMREQHYGGLG